jgi:phosphatidylethanolamine/phosphatidyl-N-methylethanolamine N-methyltransferase
MMALSFITQFLKQPKTIGAIAPSSRALAREIVSEINLPAAATIVEYGPGTGSFTREILARKHPTARYCAVERNPKMAEVFRKRFPSVHLFEDSVENLPGLLGSIGVSKADCIVSGLPWAAFSPELQDKLLAATLAVLPAGGRFATFAYLQGLLLPSGKRFRKKLNEHFSGVTKSRVVWGNLPPAFVYRCQR